MDKASFIWSVIGGIVTGAVLLAGWFLTLGRKFQILDDLKDGMKEVRGEVKSLEKNLHVLTNASVEMQSLLSGKGFTIRQQLAFTSSSPIKLRGCLKRSLA